MGTRLFLSIATVSVVVLFAFRFSETKKPISFNITEYKAKRVIRCSPDWNELKEWIEESDIPPIPGAGKHQWKISTTNDSAQFYFNQGINMYYCFHIIEAMASFKKAARFDPSCAMLYWAQALCYGPNINDFGYRASPDALAAVSKANELVPGATVFEKGLVGAMNVRYTADSADVTRTQLNEAYTGKMKLLYDKYTTQPDAQALYADAMMLQHPWDLWNTNGTPKPWTPLIRSVLEKLIVKFPGHPGGNHYYIHVMEPSPFASLALPSANRLGITNPGLSHVVHMPSHIYLRTGNYAKAVDVNTSAVNSYQRSIPLYAPVTGSDFLYFIHNLHMKTNNAMLMGNYAVAEAAAIETINSVQPGYLSLPAPMGSAVQYINMTPMFVYLRFGKWNELLQLKQPAASQVYANLLYHFGRGMAFSKKQNFIAAAKELDGLRELMKDSSLYLPLVPFSPAIEGGRVAEQLLLGAIHLDRKLYDGAIRHFKLADSVEANMVYNEPRDWLLSPKHYLGTAYLEKGDAVNAEKIFSKDLLYNNENGWALFGLYNALQVQKKNTESAKVLARFKKAFSRADIKIRSAS